MNLNYKSNILWPKWLPHYMTETKQNILLYLTEGQMCWARLQGVPGAVMWPVKILSTGEQEYSVFCKSDKAE